MRLQAASIALFALLSVASTSCATMRMAIPEDLQQAKPAEWQVTRSTGLFGKGTLSAGPIAVQGFSKGWGSAQSTTIFLHTDYQQRDPFHYQLTVESGAPLDAKCVGLLGVAKTDLGMVSQGLAMVSSRRALRCSFGGQATLALDQTEDAKSPHGHFAGALESGPVRLEIESWRKNQQTRDSFIMGFVLRLHERTVAAVEIVGDGKIWIAGDLDPEVRRAVGMAATALLLETNDWDELPSVPD